MKQKDDETLIADQAELISSLRQVNADLEEQLEEAQAMVIKILAQLVGLTTGRAS